MEGHVTDKLIDTNEKGAIKYVTGQVVVAINMKTENRKIGDERAVECMLYVMSMEVGSNDGFKAERKKCT
jgi:hypothetical protein